MLNFHFRLISLPTPLLLQVTDHWCNHLRAARARYAFRGRSKCISLCSGSEVIHYTAPEVNRVLRFSGFYSWRNPDAGSWFIQALCEELDLHGSSRDLLSLMTFVNRRVAIEYQSYVPKNEKFDAKKQIPSVVSMLTRLVYFPDNRAADDIDDGSKKKGAQVREEVM